MIKSFKKFAKLVAASSLSIGLAFSAVGCKSFQEVVENAANNENNSTTQQSSDLQDTVNKLLERVEELETTVSGLSDLRDKYNELANSKLIDLQNQLLDLKNEISGKANQDFVNESMSRLNSIIDSLNSLVESLGNISPELKQQAQAVLTTALKAKNTQMAKNTLSVQFSGETKGNDISGYDKSYTMYYSPDNGGNYAFTDDDGADIPVVTKNGLKFSKEADGSEHIENFDSNKTNILSQVLSNIETATTITERTTENNSTCYTVYNGEQILCEIYTADDIYVSSATEHEHYEGSSDISTYHTFNYENDFNFETMSASIGATMQNFVNYSKVINAIDSLSNNKFFEVTNTANEINTEGQDTVLSNLNAVFSDTSYAEKNNFNGQCYYITENGESKALEINNGKIEETTPPNMTKQEFLTQLKLFVSSGLHSATYNQEEGTYTLTLNTTSKFGQILNVKTIKVKLNENSIEVMTINEGSNLYENTTLSIIMSEEEFLNKFNQIKQELEQERENYLNSSETETETGV